MFKVYLYDYLQKSGNNLITVDGPTEVLSIPSSDLDDMWMINPTIKGEMGKAESMDFTINPGCAYYNAFQQLKTRILVKYDDAIIFYGRVLTINPSGLLQIKAIHAEGMYSVLGDTIIDGIEEKLQKKQTVDQRWHEIIDQHNRLVFDEPWKQITIGTANVDMDTTSKKRANTSAEDCLSAIDDLVDKNGGYMRLRYANGKLYLDWLKDYFRDLGDGKRPKIQIKRNLLDLSSSMEISDIFTVLVPTGSKSTTTSSTESSIIYLSEQYLRVSSLCSLYPKNAQGVSELDSGFHRYEDYEQAEVKYGHIYKSMSFSNADSESKLRSYAVDWVKRNYYGIVTTFTVKAIDMHMLGSSDPQILVGDVVDVTYPEYDQNGNQTLTTRKLLCKSIQYNLLNPEQNSYTIGVPSDLLDFEYGEKKTTSKTSSTVDNSSKKGGDGGGEAKTISFNTIRSFLLWYYRDASKKYSHAYSWHYGTDGSTNYFMDKQPATTFNSNGEITDTYCAFYETTASNAFEARVIGHYHMSPAPPYAESGFEYGVGLTSGDSNSAQVFTFSWDAYHSQNPPIPILFYFPEIHSTDFTNSSTGVTIDGSKIVDESTGDTVWTDPVTGQTAAQISVEQGGANFGYASDGSWFIKINEPITYTDPETGEEKTTQSGIVSANDFKVPEIDSFKTKFALIDDLVAARATIGELRAYMATFGSDNEAWGTDEKGNPVFLGLQGTTFKVTGDKIVGASGLYKTEKKFDENGNPVYRYQRNSDGSYKLDKDGNKIPAVDEKGNPIQEEDLVILDGSGLKVEENGSSFGVFHDGNLTGGILVDRLNDGSTTTRIKGTRVIVGEGLDDKTVEEWTDELIESGEQGTGVFANYFRAKTVTANNVNAKNSLDVQGNAVIDKYVEIHGGLFVGNLAVGTTTSSMTPTTVTAKYIHVGSEGALQFTDGHNDFNLQVADAKALITDIKIVETGNSGEYELKYLPITKDPEQDYNWVSAGTFKKAASLSGTWSGSKYTVSAGDQSKSIAFGVNADVVLTVSHDGEIVQSPVNPKLIFVPYQVKQIEEQSSGAPVETIRYQPDPVTIDGKTVRGTVIDVSNYYNTVYSSGKTDEKKLIYTRFAYDSEDGYYIEPYEGSTAHAAGLTNGMLQYEMGFNSANRRVQLQNPTTHAYISGTPTFTVSADILAVTLDIGTLNTTTGERTVSAMADGTVIESKKLTDYKDGQNSIHVVYNPEYNNGSITLKAVVPSVSGSSYIPLFVDFGSVNASGERTVTAKAGSATIDSSTITDYKDGFDAVTLGAISWNTTDSTKIGVSNIVKCAASNRTDGTTRSSQRTIYLTQDSDFSSHKKWVWMHDNSATGTQVGKIQVDATSEYNNGYDTGAGTAFGKTAIEISADPSQQASAISLSADKYYEIVVKGSDHSGSEVSGTSLIVKTASGGGYTGLEIDDTNKKIKASTTSTTSEVTIGVTAPTLTYDGTTHKYTATASAKAGTTIMETKSGESGTAAYTAGWNDGGKTARIASIDTVDSLPSGETSNGTFNQWGQYKRVRPLYTNASGNNVTLTGTEETRYYYIPALSAKTYTSNGTYTVNAPVSTITVDVTQSSSIDNIDLTADSNSGSGYSEKGNSGTSGSSSNPVQCFTGVSFPTQRWFRFKITASGPGTKYYAFYIKS